MITVPVEITEHQLALIREYQALMRDKNPNTAHAWYAASKKVDDFARIALSRAVRKMDQEQPA